MKDIRELCASMWRYFIEAVTVKYADFRGTASRKEYVSFVVFYWIIFGLIAAISLLLCKVVSPDSAMRLGLNYIRKLYTIVLIIPWMAMSARRLHDAGFSIWLLPYTYSGTWSLFLRNILGAQYLSLMSINVSNIVVMSLLFPEAGSVLRYTLPTEPWQLAFVIFKALIPVFIFIALVALPSDANSEYVNKKYPPLEPWKRNMIVVGIVLFIGLGLFNPTLWSMAIGGLLLIMVMGSLVHLIVICKRRFFASDKT